MSPRTLCYFCTWHTKWQTKRPVFSTTVYSFTCSRLLYNKKTRPEISAMFSINVKKQKGTIQSTYHQQQVSNYSSVITCCSLSLWDEMLTTYIPSHPVLGMPYLIATGQQQYEHIWSPKFDALWESLPVDGLLRKLNAFKLACNQSTLKVS